MNDRPTVCHRLLALAFLPTLLLPGELGAAPLMDLDLGIKGGLGASLLLVEDGFANEAMRRTYAGDDAFGLGGGGGVYTELRLFDRVGLELDVLFSYDHTSRTEEWSFAGTTEQLNLVHDSWAKNMRFPVLLKGYQSFGVTRLSLGVGVEYVKPLDHGYDITKARRSTAEVDEQSLADYLALHHSVPQDSIFLLGQLELAIDLGVVQIPIDLRAGRNLTQTDQFEDRWAYLLEGGQPVRYDIQALYSWDFRALVGVAASF
ncbi:MAG: hypothetical protein RBU45_23730 [Myxococcota bacterium]|jgi:hypothetical protein|nr:hypothetical protein [Myxococcota bacterium]